jgi:hypothetical protein
MKSFHETHNLTLDEVLTKLSVINLRTYNVNVHINLFNGAFFIVSNNVSIFIGNQYNFFLSQATIEKHRPHSQSAKHFIESQLTILSNIPLHTVSDYDFISQRKSFKKRHAKTFSSIIL